MRNYDFRCPDKLLEKLDTKRMEYTLNDRSDIIRRALRKFFRLVLQNKNKTLSDIQKTFEEFKECKTEKISFRVSELLVEPLYEYNDNRSEIINQILAWYFKLDDEAKAKRPPKTYTPPPDEEYILEEVAEED